MPYKSRRDYLQYRMTMREQAQARGDCTKCYKNPARISKTGKELTTCQECRNKAIKWYSSRHK